MGKSKFLLSAIATLSMAILPAFAAAQEIQSVNTSMSHCKFDDLPWLVASTPTSDETDSNEQQGDSETVINKWYDSEIDSKERHWIMDYDAGTLNIVWYNELKQCAYPGDYVTLSKEEGNVLKIYRETKDPDAPEADCICLFDTFASFADIDPGKYHMVFIRRVPETYWSKAWEGIEMEVDVELKDGMKSIYNANTVGVNQSNAQADDAIRLTPDGVLKVNTASSYLLEIFNADGEIIISTTCQPGSDCSVSALPRGIYIAKASSNGKSHSLKFIR